MIRYQIESLASCVAEIKQHAPAHWAEVASFKDSRPLAMDWAMYAQAEQMGRLVLGTARSSAEGGRLIGYLCMLQRSDPHSTGVKGAESAFYYVEKRPMRGLVQRNLIKFMCNYLAKNGVQFIRFRNKLTHDNASILENIGFAADEMLYVLKTGV